MNDICELIHDRGRLCVVLNGHDTVPVTIQDVEELIGHLTVQLNLVKAEQWIRNQ